MWGFRTPENAVRMKGRPEMKRLKSTFLVLALLAANLGFFVTETSGDLRAWGECGMSCSGPGECDGFCVLMLENICDDDDDCQPPPLACEECV
jgi:hypothetical protein